jgi:hypothetical protein
MSDASLLMLVGEVRRKTLRLLDGVSEPDARWTPQGLNNHILWNAGHVLVVVEHLSVATATGQPPQYPAGWFEMFSWASKPARVTDWPSLAQVTDRLVTQVQRLTSALEALSPAQLDQEIGEPPAPRRPLRYSILHGLHDEACHQGEIHLLKKLIAQSR